MSVKDAINQAITLLDRITVEADEDSALGMAFVSGRISEDGFYITKNDLERSLKELEHQLAQAHRDATEEVAKAHKRGWEQAKRECEIVVDKYRQSEGFHQGRIAAKCISDAIAAMKYGGKAND